MKTTQTVTTLQVPHARRSKREAAQASEAAHSKKKTNRATKQSGKTMSAGRDAFGGRIGSRMSAINLVVINAGADGATVPEVAEKTGESAAIVSAQLGWAVHKLKVATRKEETPEKGRKTFRYFSKINSKE